MSLPASPCGSQTQAGGRAVHPELRDLGLGRVDERRPHRSSRQALLAQRRLGEDHALGAEEAEIDGQQFLVRKSLGLKSADELKGASICVQSGTTNELNLADFFATHGLTYRPVVYERLVEVLGAYASGRCDAFTTDSSQLVAERLRLPDPDQHVMLPDLISKEPLGPAVRQGDAMWSNIVRWTLFALVAAEEYGVTAANAEEMTSSENPEIRRLLGAEGDLGPMLGLEADWAKRAIMANGNYGEIFAATIGEGTPSNIARGLNALWTEGGLQYAPPFR